MKICRSLTETIMNRGVALVHLPWPEERFGTYGSRDPRYSDAALDKYVHEVLEVAPDMMIGAAIPGRATRGQSTYPLPCIVVAVLSAIADYPGQSRRIHERSMKQPTPTTRLDFGHVRTAWFDGPDAR